MAERPLLLAIDTVSDVAGAAVLEAGTLIAETTWRARQSHSVQLLPAIDWLLSHMGRSKDDVGAVAVCLGPGSYAGMRVGVSTAKALAYGLGARLVGVGRFAAEALPLAEASARRIVPVQAAGRAEFAWGAYAMGEEGLVELASPQIGTAEKLLTAVQRGDIVTGDIDRLDESTLSELATKDCRLLPATGLRVLAVARLGMARLDRGESDDPDSLEPLYLRAPAIGPQAPR